MVTTAQYQAVLDGIMTAIEALDPTDYAWDATDAWHQARTPDEISHLAVWLHIDGMTELDRSMYRHTLTLTWPCRYVADDDALSQSRALASMSAVIEMLLLFSAESCRLTSIEEARVDRGDWLTVTVSATLLVRRS